MPTVQLSPATAESGFQEKPVYETLREFINERIGDSRLHEPFHAIVAECAGIASSMGVEIGRRVGEDATDIRSLKFNDEAEYSGCYRHSGYKADIVRDLDDQSLVLDCTPMGINGIRLQYRIERDWKHNSAGDGHEIRRLYQK